jgi:hypothetical protein
MEAATENEITLTTRRAEVADVAKLAMINQELIRHEWSGENKELEYLEKRLEQWIVDPSYSATIFERSGRFAAYALIRFRSNWILAVHGLSRLFNRNAAIYKRGFSGRHLSLGGCSGIS